MVSVDNLEQLEPEEIGWMILDHLNKNPPQVFRGNAYRNSATLQFSHACQICELQSLSNPERLRAESLLMEGWQWLEHVGLLTLDPSQSNSAFKIITRRGKSIDTEQGMLDFRGALLLPEEIVHPQILMCSKNAFLRGDYDSAIFNAFRQVEILVRNAIAAPDSKIGVTLMREAFHPATGALTNPDLVMSERENMQQLFAGAIGSFKNPSSHRQVEFAADEAVELLMLASRLVKIVEERVHVCAP